MSCIVARTLLRPRVAAAVARLALSRQHLQRSLARQIATRGTVVSSRDALVNHRLVPSPVRQFSTVAPSYYYDNEDYLDVDADYESPLQELFDQMESQGYTWPLDALPPIVEKTKYLKCGVPESALRFTTTCYGRLLDAPKVHPNEHRVILKVNGSDLPLSDNELEMEILKEIVGSRYNEDRDELQLSSVQFGSRIENKRHLVSMLDRIVSSSKRLANEIISQGQHRVGGV